MAIPFLRKAALFFLLIAVTTAWADDRAEYNRRAAARYVELFQTLDRDTDGRVTREESRGDLNFSPFFDDMDINRDGVVSKDELHRFMEQRYGVTPAPAPR